MEIAHLNEDGIFSELLSVENYEVAYQAQPCNALKRPYIYNMRADRQDNFRQSKAKHAISPVSHITFKGESADAWNGHSCTKYLPRIEGVTIEEEDRGYNIGKRGNEEEINRPSMANINRHQGQMGVR